MNSMFRTDSNAKKLYKIYFNTYTNAYPGDTVRHNDDDMVFLHCDEDGSLIIKEDEFFYYRHFGDGIKSMNYIGLFYEIM
ncbi:MAG: hypothetical protein IJH34_17355 [Romboutsia sp.]|nr:hypothetical protein [Romboutsia sp.]